jgi:hypothetical protein
MKTRQYNNGDTCSVSANPGSHYTFDGWFENDSIVSSDNPYSFTVSGDRTLEGKFTANSYTITTNVSPVSGGSISGGGTYDYGDTCTLTATENQDYRFATWTDGDGNFLSNDNPFSFTVSGDLTVRGVFSTGYNTYTITVISSNGSVSGDGVYALDDTCTLTSTPNAGYLFDHWEMNGVEISDDNPYSFTVDGDKTITAVYEVSPVSLKITTNGTSSITLINSSNNTYSLSLNSGYNEYLGTEPGFALDEITSMRFGSNQGKYISIDAFYLTSLTSLPNNAFYQCSNLQSFVLPDSLTSIGYNAFGECTNLETINIPDSVIYFGGPNGRVFYQCLKLRSSIDLSNTNITTIGNNTFYQCLRLTSITLPDSITTIGDNAFYQCYDLTSITLPDSVVNIGSHVFDGCYYLSTVNLPNTMTSVKSWMFGNCKSLTSLSFLPNSITTIENDAFAGCNFIAITIPDNITTIGDYAFSACNDLTSITCLATTPPTLGNNVFISTNDCPIYVPAASLSAYQSAWSQYASRLNAL